VQDYPLGPLLGQCCGGRVRMLIERLEPDDSHWLVEVARRHRDSQPFTLRMTFGEVGIAHAVLPDADIPTPSARDAQPGPGDTVDERHLPRTLGVLLFGAGHVGLALARTLEPLPIRLRWRDTRPEYAERPDVDLVGEDTAVALAAEGPEDEALLVMTHDHALDYRLVAAALAGPRRFVGLIGSASKRARFISRLRKDGLDDAALARLVCPVGRSDIPGKEPEVIAIAVAAQLLSLRT
jgi:xanthine dehydrogenase accessory factor